MKVYTRALRGDEHLSPPVPVKLKGHFTHMKLFFKITEIETLINITYIVRFLRSTDVSVLLLTVIIKLSMPWALPFFFVYPWCDVTGVGVKEIVDGVVT